MLQIDMWRETEKLNIGLILVTSSFTVTQINTNSLNKMITRSFCLTLALSNIGFASHAWHPLNL